MKIKMRDLYTKCTQKKIFHKKVQITSTLINKLQQFKLYSFYTSK